ncbi:MAG TPA: DnaJ domain-containing protein [bacterium]|nr:DnaJ domain-containing protein [bacterium]
MGNDERGDRRVAARADSFLPFEIEGREQYTADYIENLSTTGAYVRTADPAPLRTRLRISILAPKSRRKFLFDAEVMRVIEPEHSLRAGLPPGMGISFLDLGGGDPRPKAVEILNEVQALEAEAEARSITLASPAPAPAPAAAPQNENAEAIARLEQFVTQARTQNYYELLGVDAATADEKSVKKHYHRRSKEFHPDRFHRMRTPEIDAKVEELYGMLTRAYETLKDPVKREAYDKANGIRESVEFRRAAAKARFAEALAQIERRRLFAATLGLKIALGLDPGNPEMQRKLDELERAKRFFTT